MGKRLSEKGTQMPITVLYECSKCSGVFMAAQGQKTHSCPYCGTRVDLQKAKRIIQAKDAFEASEMLKKIKTKRQNNTRKLQ
jgi:DNA-directed RNA polymerase subunit RPC12/RpoP